MLHVIRLGCCFSVVVHKPLEKLVELSHQMSGVRRSAVVMLAFSIANAMINNQGESALPVYCSVRKLMAYLHPSKTKSKQTLFWVKT